MSIEDWLIPSGVRVHAGEEGLLYNDIGRIVASKALLHGVDEHLWTCLRIAVDQLELAIGLYAPDPDNVRAVMIH